MTRLRGGLGVARSLALLLALLSFHAPLAHADDAAQARFHDELARGHYAAGRYQDALREFFLSQRVAPNPRTLYNLALCFEEIGDEADAFFYYAEYLASDDASAERRAEVEASLARLRAAVALADVVTDPPGARIYVDERSYGAYGTTPRQVPLEPGEHRVWAELEGHRPAEATVRVAVGRTERVSLTLTPILVEVHVEGPAAGLAAVRDADGRTVAEGALPLDARVPPGLYEVAVAAEGHEAWVGVVRARVDTPETVRATPAALPPPSGEITVTSSTRGAMVLLDGTPTGFTPAVLSDLPVGRHHVEVRADALQPWSGDVDVAEDRRAWLTVSLERGGTSVDRSPATWVLGGLGLAALAGAGVTGGLVVDLHGRYYRGGPESGDPALAERGRDLGLATDVLLGGGAALLVTGVVLFFATETRDERASRASVSEEAAR